MAGESVVVRSAFGTICASEAIANGAFSSSGNASDIANNASIVGNEKDYPALDFRIFVTAGTVTVGDKFHIYRIPFGSTTFGQEDNYLGTIEVYANNYYYFYGAANIEQTDKFQLKSATTNTLTVSLDVRTRAIEPGA